tara:strand:- start:85 stop:468 length:384 start_codon:yes stop_codon:yes gene_type:complete
MLQSLSKTIIVLSIFILIGCETSSSTRIPHPVKTLDRSQAESMRCVYLYRSSKTVTGWSTASATANALRELKDQAIVAEGNAVVIISAYPTNVWRDGYELDGVNLSVDVYKCQGLKGKNELYQESKR